MYIAPNSIVRLLKGVTIDPTHENTIYFETPSAQTAYFVSKVKYTFERVSYQRANKGVVKVERNAESLYDCNYIMFQNLAFGNKWFYGFITDVEYINDTTAAVYYEIDELQTWFFDFSLNQCFVEREHAATDEVGDNLVPENLETGEYIIKSSRGTGLAGMASGVATPTPKPAFVVLTTVIGDGNGGVTNAETGTYINGLYSGIRALLFDEKDNLESFIELATRSGKADGIMAIYQIPRWIYSQISESFPFDSGNMEFSYSKELNISEDALGVYHFNPYGPFGNYTPKNKKLWTYPFNYLNVTQNNGKSAELRFEFFKNAQSLKFQLRFNIGAIIAIKLAPLEYKLGEGVQFSPANWNEQTVIADIPQCAWTNDAFQAWLAQNMGGLAANLITGTASAAVTAVANPAAGALAVGGMIANQLAQAYTHSIMPPQSHGSQSGSANIQMGLFDFVFQEVKITESFARIIDSYFDRYGYATKITKTPNRSARPHWNYVKTIGCTISGSIPADAERRICEIHDAGVTYWKNGDEVGDYSLNNSIS